MLFIPIILPLTIKRILSILFSFMAAMSFGQDSLSLASGRIWEVEILRTSETELEYVRNGKTVRMKNKEVFEYKKDGQWFYIDPKTYKPKARNKATYVYEPQLMTKNNPEASRKFKFGFTGNVPYENFIRRSFSQIYFQLNPYVRLEPEVLISNKLSIKFPVVIGFGYSNDINETTVETHHESGYGYYYNLNHDQPRGFRVGELSFNSVNNYTQLPEFSSQHLRYYTTSYSSYTATPHTYELIGQIGASFKWYPLGEHKKNSFYISNSVNIGLGNMNQVDYYIQMDTLLEENSADEFIPIWRGAKDSIVSNRKLFPYFRYELAFGLDLNLVNNWGISMELGYSTPIHFGLVPEDNIYVKSVFGGDYVLSGQTKPKFDNGNWGILSGSPVLRFAVYYRFGKTLEKK